MLGAACCAWSCGSNATGGATGTGGASAIASSAGGALATGGASAAGGSAKTGGAVSTGGATGAGGATGVGGATGAGGATGTPVTTLADACAKNCALAYNLDTCATTEDVCVQSCMTTLDNTTAVQTDLGRQYTVMMLCVANDPSFATSAGFTCAKPDRALNKWTPLVDANTLSPCKQEICDWNCNDATAGNFDPWVTIPCHCSSV